MFFEALRNFGIILRFARQAFAGAQVSFDLVQFGGGLIPLFFKFLQPLLETRCRRLLRPQAFIQVLTLFAYAGDFLF